MSKQICSGNKMTHFGLTEKNVCPVPLLNSYANSKTKSVDHSLLFSDCLKTNLDI